MVGASCGVIANVVEKAKTCHDGDSVQVGGCVVGVCMCGGGASCGVIANVVEKTKTCHDGNFVQVGGCGRSVRRGLEVGLMCLGGVHLVV